MTNDSPATSTIRADILDGLSSSPKRLDSKYLYDERGSKLFEQICDTEAYYPTRTEIGILERHGADIAEAIGPDSRLVELGSGSGVKTRLLLSQLQRPKVYVPVDISSEMLASSAAALRAEFPELDVRPVAADYTRELSAALDPDEPATVFFPGSTIGNFTRERARSFLTKIAGLLGPGGELIIGVDTKKDPAVLDRAYNDAEGVTADFNLNLLARLNRELDADFDLDSFRFHAFYHPVEGRVESYLVSLKQQSVTVGEATFAFDRAEPIHTEYSYKYNVGEFQGLAGEAGFVSRQVWTDDREWFSVHHLVVD